DYNRKADIENKLVVTSRGRGKIEAGSREVQSIKQEQEITQVCRNCQCLLSLSKT
ncbi:unnamed protein product, partial [Rangifer tarandus platyrhynchus]